MSRNDGSARPRRASGGGEPGAALLGGGGAALVVAVSLAVAIRPRLLFDPDPSWALARLLLSLAVLAAAGAAAVASAAALVLWSRTRAVRKALDGLPIPRGALAGLAFAAIVLGALARFAALDRLPAPLWVDDLSLIPAALSLQGSPADFADPVRPSPYGVPAVYGSVPVLYLEAYRAALLLFGTTVFGVRFLSAAAGVLSIATAMALGRALLPRGGGAIAGLAVAGMRWHLILSRWAWNAIVVVPLLDVAALLLIAGRRRRAMAAVAGAGAVAGLGAHVYLAAWIALAALTAFLLWPSTGTTRRWRLGAAAVFAGTFLLVASPLLLTGGKTPYFRRAGEHNVLLEIRRQRSAMPLFASAAGALAAPWFLPDPSPWNDLPGKTRLGWVLGIPVAAGLTRALLRRGEEVSGFLLAHAAAGFAATVVWGTEMQPNGYRVAYLTTVTGVSVAAGSLSLLSLVPAGGKRAAAIGILGLLAISGALAARDVFLRWGPMLEAWEGYQGRDNLLARSAMRWGRYGSVSLDPRLSSVLASRSMVFFDVLVRYSLGEQPQAQASGVSFRARRSERRFLVAPPGVSPEAGERIVERVRDGRGTLWAIVLGERKQDRGSSIEVRRE